MARAKRISVMVMTALALSRAGWARFPVEELTTNKAVYKQGEAIEINLNVSNTGTEEVVLWTGACGCAAFETEVLDAEGNLVAWYEDLLSCISQPCGYHYPPGFSGDLFYHSWEQILGWFPRDPFFPEPPVFAPPGEYRLRVTWDDETLLYSQPFVIVERAPPIPATSGPGGVILVAAIAIVGAAIARRSSSGPGIQC